MVNWIWSEMSVRRACYQVSGPKIARDASSRRATNFYHTPLTAVYTNGTLVSSTTRAAYTKPFSQPKIMSPGNCSSTQRSNYVTSLSIIPKEKIPQVVILPSIDRDITVPSARSVSPKNPVATSVDKKIRESRTSAKASKLPAKKYISCLHTSLSTEWRKDSVDQESYGEDKTQRTSLQIECNNKTKNTRTTASTAPSISRVGDKNYSKAVPHRTDPDLSGPFFDCKNCEENTGMNNQTVRVQRLPASGKSFTIKDTIHHDEKPRSGKNTSAVSAPRSLGQPTRQGLRPRMLPKSRFRVKIQKCHHKSVNISDAHDCTVENKEKILEKESRSVVVQEKSPQRSFSLQRLNF